MRWISLAILVAAGALLLAFWGDVPERWIIHWGLHGRPDGWATKSVASALTPLIIGLCAWLMCEVVALVILHSAGAPRELALIHATVVRAVGLALSLLLAGLTLALPFLHPRSSLPIVAAAVVDTTVALAITAAWASRRIRRLRDSGVAVPEGYGALFYSNARDSRLWVPKLNGMGWTINMAHRFAWLVLIAIVGTPLLIVLLVGLLGR